MIAPPHVTCVDVFGKKHEIAISELRWRPSAYGVVIRGDKVLLCKQFGKYNLPGGGIELGEKPQEAVLREVKEETGIDVVRPRLLGVESDFFRMSHDEDKASFQTLLLYYACEYVGGNAQHGRF
jgi:8-oxo-dGTP diphosphatase